MRKIKAIVFDLDDTLIDSEKAYAAALDIIRLPRRGHWYQQARRTVKARLGANSPSSHNRLLYFKEIADMKKKFSSLQVLDLMSRYEVVLTRIFQSQWKRLRRDKLMRSLEKKYALYIISNETLRMQLIKLRAMDPRGKYFRSILTSEEAGAEKPHPKIFRQAIAKFGIDPRSSLYVGNDYATDVVPAKKFNFYSALSCEFGPQPNTKESNIKNCKILQKLDQIESWADSL